MKHELANLLSISLVFVFLYPWFLFVATKNKVFLLLGVATFLIDQSTKVYKRILGTKSIFGRPKGACNCDILCRNGKQEGKPGFPSGHMTTASFVATFLVFTYYPRLWPVALGYVVAVGWARYVKKCHNMYQIIAGTCYGTFVGLTLANFCRL